MAKPKTKPLFISIPHSGEKVPPEVHWLKNLPEPILMCDVDRFVDRLYEPALKELGIPAVVTEWHRYVVDLNRWPDDVDVDSVKGSKNAAGQFPMGFHWSVTTLGYRLMPEPISPDLHKQLAAKYFEPFHEEIRGHFAEFEGHSAIYHIDAHSMPSKGTKAHRDPGEVRADIVVSDVEGKSCSAQFKDLVIQAYKSAGFRVAYNWPYLGGRVTQTYGQPERGHHSLQVEMNRALYMDETSKKLLDQYGTVQVQIKKALSQVLAELPL